MGQRDRITIAELVAPVAQLRRLIVKVRGVEVMRLDAADAPIDFTKLVPYVREAGRKASITAVMQNGERRVARGNGQVQSWGK